MKTILILFLALTLGGCSAKGASFQQGVYAGQAQGRIVANHDEEARESAYWQGVAYNYQRRDIETTGANARAKAATLRDSKLAAQEGWNAATKYSRELLNLQEVHNTASANRNGRKQIAETLSWTPVDVFEMSKKQDEARSNFVKSTMTMGLTETGNIIVDWQEAEARSSALKEQEKREEDLAKREKSLAERIAELDAHETPAETTDGATQ